MRLRFLSGAMMGVLLVLLPILAYGQAEITGRIGGVVVDASKALIPGVTVKVEGATLFTPRTMVTAEDASYLIDKLPPGTYKVTFTFPGFKTVVQNDTVVRANFTATLNITLEVGNVEETLMVTEVAPVVDVRSATLATSFDAALLKEIPHGRDTWSMLAQVPGLTPAKFDVGGSESFQQTATQVHGSQGTQVVYSVNGLNMNWPGGNGGVTAFYFDNDGFDEVQVTTDAAQAEIGAGGVHMNMITRQGTNNWHGGLIGYYTTSALTSAYNKPIFSGLPVEAGTTITMMRDTNVNAAGHLVKDRLWVYSGYRRYDINLAVPAVKRPDGSAIKDNNHQSNVNSRIDMSLSQRQKLALVWHYNDINRFYRRGTFFTDDVAAGLQLEHAWIGQILYTYTPLSSLVLDSRFGNMTQHFNFGYRPEVQPGTIAVIDNVLNTLKFAKENANINSVWHRRFSQTMSYFKGGLLGGSHNIRAGFEYAGLRNQNVRTVNRDLNVYLANGQPLFARLFNTPLRAVERIVDSSAYIQDSVVVRKLTINLGLRYDHFRNWLPVQTSPAGTYVAARSFPRSPNIVDWNNFSPRVGVAYDISGRGRSVVRASYNKFTLLEGSRLSQALNPNFVSSTDFPFTALGPDNFPIGLGNPILREGGIFTKVDPNLKRPFSQQITAGFEHQLYGDLRIGVGYFYRDVRDNYSRVNLGAPREAYAPVRTTNPLTNEPLTIYSLARERVGQSEFLIKTFPELDDIRYHGLEFTAAKRFTNNWQVLSGFTIQRKKGTRFSETGDDFNNPNRDIFRKDNTLENDSTYVFKLAGTYNLPRNIKASANFQHYTGYPYVPTSVFRTGLNQGNETINLEPRGPRRFPQVNLLNVRIGYVNKVREHYTLEPSIDIYNIFNKNTVTNAVTTIGPNYLRPTTITGQRFVRFGLKIDW